MRKYELIQSEQNQWLKKCKALQQKKYRQEYKEFIAEGLRFVEEALNSHAEIKMILVAEQQTQLLEKLFIPQDIPVMLVQKGLLEKCLNTVNPQGIVAIIGQPEWSWDELAKMKRFLIVDGVQDPGNLGTILRTALAAGTEAVLCLKGTVDVYNDKTLRSTMGAIFREPIYFIEDVDSLLQDLQQWGVAVLVSDIRAEKNYMEMTFPEKTALVVSNEANGPQLIKNGDLLVKIPLAEGAESLNVAVATGILLYAIQTGGK
ncbi:MAG: RNA methyltransferase [Peptococcaceae bacterium]|nr:RNA methyltransferase [Peptococcaceae bacterium]